MLNVLIDLDGVLVDFVKGITDVKKRPDIHEAALRGELTMENFEEEMKISKEEMLTLLDVRGKGFWENLPILQGAEELMDLIQTHEDVGSFSICTMLCGSIWCPAGKQSWIQKRMPDVPYFMTSRKSTSDPCPKCAFAKEGTLLIDDSRLTCEMFRSCGGHAIHYTGYTHNVKANIERVGNEIKIIEEGRDTIG